MKWLYHLIFYWVTFIILTTEAVALPTNGIWKLSSPNNEYTLKLFDKANLYDYEIKLFRYGKQIVQYPWSGEILSAYWSPHLRFVAINNHYGHGGYIVWLLSLTDGSVITSHGIVKDSKYDKYSDDNDFVDLRDQAAGQLKKIYPQVDTDQLRNGYDSVAYGWRGDHQLLMFHQFGFDNLSTNYNMLIQAFTTWNVTNRGVSFRNVWFRKARDDKYEPMPEEVKKTLDY